MYVVVLRADGAPTSTIRTSKPGELVDRLIKNFVGRGMWVQCPLLPGYPAEYAVYRNGKRCSTFTVREDNRDE